MTGDMSARFGIMCHINVNAVTPMIFTETSKLPDVTTFHPVGPNGVLVAAVVAPTTGRNLARGALGWSAALRDSMSNLERVRAVSGRLGYG